MYYLETDDGFLASDDTIVDDLDYAQSFADIEDAEKRKANHPNPDKFDIYEDVL